MTGGARLVGYDLLRILSILGVIAIHTFGVAATRPELRGTVAWFVSLALSSGMIWVVPTFVMLAGALSLRAEAFRGGARDFFVRRARRVLPAAVVWTAVYLVGVRILLLGEPLSPTAVATILVDGTAYPHLYFLYLIAGLYLVAPVLAAFLREGGTRRAVLTAAAALGLTLLVFLVPGLLALRGVDRPVNLQTLTFWLGYVGYFLAGYALSRIRVGRTMLIVAVTGFVLLGLLIMVEAAFPDLTVLRAVLRPDYLGIGVAALSVCAFVAGTTLLDRIRVGTRGAAIIRSLADATFGVFLVHLLVLLVPYELLPGFRDSTSVAQTALAYVVIVVVSFGISLLARRIPAVRLVF